MTAAANVTSTLLVDFYPKASATATAADNLVRCLLDAGVTALVDPMICGIGRGVVLYVFESVRRRDEPMIWSMYFLGQGGREEWRVRKEERCASAY